MSQTPDAPSPHASDLKVGDIFAGTRDFVWKCRRVCDTTVELCELSGRHEDIVVPLSMVLPGPIRQSQADL